MSTLKIESVPARLSRNTYNLDEEESHIEVDQERARATGAGKLLERICPAHVYSVEEDGTVGVEYAACLECGTCLAIAPEGVLKWHYPRSGFGIMFREGYGLPGLKWWVYSVRFQPTTFVVSLESIIAAIQSAIFPWVREWPSAESLPTRSGRHSSDADLFSPLGPWVP